MSDDCGFCHFGMIRCRVLHFDGRNPLAARLDDILDAISDGHVTLGINGGHIAGLEPAFVRMSIRSFQFKITGAHPGAPDQKRAESHTVPRQVVAFIVHNFHLYAENLPARLEAHFGELLLTKTFSGTHARVDRTQRAHLCHTPTDPHLYTVVIKILHDG